MYYQPQPDLDSSYYQPQPATYNQRQQYCQDIMIQQARSKNYYNREKVGNHGNIHSRIPTPEKVPIIPLGKSYYARKKDPTDSSTNSLKTATSRIHKKVTTIFSIKR